jgi:hypothetical protein
VYGNKCFPVIFGNGILKNDHDKERSTQIGKMYFRNNIDNNGSDEFVFVASKKLEEF